MKIIEYIKKHKVPLIVLLVVWFLGELFLIAPMARTISDSTVNGSFDITIFFENILPNIASLDSFPKIFTAVGIGAFLRWSIIWIVLLVIALAVGIYNSKSKGDYDKIEHGSSDWAEGGEQYTVLSKNQGLILAKDNYLPLNKLGNVNVLIVGGSGSGKSSAYSIPNAHQCLGSYVFTDPKGEIYDATAGFLKSQGYDIKILNLVNPKSSDSYNPLFHIQSEIDVDVIASTIVRGQESETTKGSDPYWDNMSELLLKALIYYLIATRPPEEQNLASCAELVRAANNNGDSNLLSDLINKLPYDHPARMNYKSVEIASEKTYQSILSSLQSSLGKFDSKEIADVTSTNTINFEDIARRKTALYVISSDTHSAYDFLLTIFFSQMIQHLYDFADKNGGKLPVQTFFILDEFANIGQVPDFDKKISTSRSRNISFSVILQNLDQLKAIYEKSYETIIGNCDTHVFLGSNSYATVEYFSKELGEKTISHKSKSINRDNEAKRKGYSESDQIMGRALMTPDELRRMDNNDCIIFEKGVKPIRAKKFWWFQHQNIVKDLNSVRLSHNDYTLEDRGNWRKFNPYNPYVEENNNEHDRNDLEVGSLDDLFEENTNQNKSDNQSIYQAEHQVDQKLGVTADAKKEEVKQKDQETQINLNNNLSNYLDKGKEEMAAKAMAQPQVIIPEVQNNANGANNAQRKPLSKVDMMEQRKEQVQDNDEEDIDIEKELEAKFDELFGKIQ